MNFILRKFKESACYAVLHGALDLNGFFGTTFKNSAWILLAQDRVQWGAVVKSVINFQAS
jgi:hypothetical protein